jgi:hypothetical protein
MRCASEVDGRKRAAEWNFSPEEDRYDLGFYWTVGGPIAGLACGSQHVVASLASVAHIVHGVMGHSPLPSGGR